MADTFVGELPEMYRSPERVANRWRQFTNTEIYDLAGVVRGDLDLSAELEAEWKRRRINPEARCARMWERYHETVARLEARGALG